VAFCTGPAAGRVRIYTRTMHTRTLYTVAFNIATIKWPLVHYKQSLHCSQVAQWFPTLCIRVSRSHTRRGWSLLLYTHRPRCKVFTHIVTHIRIHCVVSSRTSRTHSTTHSSRVGINGSTIGFQGRNKCLLRVHFVLDNVCQRCYYTCTLINCP